MKKIIKLFVPTIIFVFILLAVFVIENQANNYIIDFFNLESTRKINAFNTYFIYIIGFLMLYLTYMYSRDVNVRIFRILVFILNIAGITLVVYFVLSFQMLYFL